MVLSRRTNRRLILSHHTTTFSTRISTHIHTFTKSQQAEYLSTMGYYQSHAPLPILAVLIVWGIMAPKSKLVCFTTDNPNHSIQLYLKST